MRHPCQQETCGHRPPSAVRVISTPKGGEICSAGNCVAEAVKRVFTTEARRRDRHDSRVAPPPSAVDVLGNPSAETQSPEKYKSQRRQARREVSPVRPEGA